MKRFTVIFFFCLAAMTAALFAPARALAGENLEAALKIISENRQAFSDSLATGWYYYKGEMDDRCADPDYKPQEKWKKGGASLTWVGNGQAVWLRTTYTVPEKVADVNVAGSKAIFHASASGNGDIWIDGNHKNSFRYDQGEALLGMEAQPGKKFLIVMRLASRDVDPAGVFMDAFVTFSALEETQKRIDDYLNKVKTVKLFLGDLEEKEQARWDSVMEESAAMIDLEALEARDREKFFLTLDKASARLDEFGSFAKKYTMYLLGYSHIDLAWLWDYDEGERVWKNTAQTVFNLFEEYPDFIFTETQAHGYKWMEDDFPEIYDQLHKYYNAGRWEITGGTWSEHDSNVPSGEGFVRQFLYGKLYFREKFGKDVTVAWTPDSFGYNWNLPQILLKSGMTGFLTQKINWNDTTKFPYNIFWWEGPDGSRLLTYFPVGGYGESVDADRMIDQLKRIKEKHGVDENFVIFGVGDHGGGVTRGHLDRAFALKDNPVYPEIKFTTADKYFSHLHDLAKDHDFPTWDDELYLQYHRGTYTTQANTKRNNRQGEILMEVAEKFSSIADRMGYEYPADKIFRGWYYILLNHMHDILPGSGINKVYQDADKDYAKQQKLGDAVLTGALETIAEKAGTVGDGWPIVLFNPLSWPRDGIIEIPLERLPKDPSILDTDGNPVASQVIKDAKGKELLTFIAKKLPPVGYAVYHTVEGKLETPSAGLLKVDNTTLENEFIKATLDPQTGTLVSLVDKRSGKEYIEPGNGANFLQLYDDKPKEYDAWNIGIGDAKYLDRMGDVEVVEYGPVRATLKFGRQVASGFDSKFAQYVTLYAGRPLLDGRINVKWQERNVIAKLAFNLNLKSETAWFEIPYAAIERRAVAKTAEDQAKWEISGHKWVDYTDDSGDYGLSLLNNSKYGFDVKNNVLRMTLLRSPIAPDPLADRGFHTIPYALYPHDGKWQDAQTTRRAHEFNYPVQWLMSNNHPGDLPPVFSFYSCEPDNVILSVVKKAENKQEYIIRLYESTGKDSTATIILPENAASVVETNLIEDEIGIDVPFTGRKITVPIGHFEIKTLKISYY